MTQDTARVTTPRRRASSRAFRTGGAAHWIYLVYLLNLGWQPFFDPTTGVLDLVVVAVVVIAFVPLWALARTRDRDRLRVLAIAMIALGVAGTLFNVGASVVFVYAAAVVAPLGDDEALRFHVGITFIIVLLMAVSPIELPYRIYGVLPALVFVWVIGLESRRGAAHVAEAERLRIDNVRIEALATAAERDRIARDLHDLLGQSLTGLVVRAQLVQRLAEVDPPAAVEEAAGLEDGARAALEQVRAAVSGLSDVSLDDELDAARRVLAAAGVEADVRVLTTARPGALGERSLALALREAVTNVVRHAEAGTCRIELSRLDETWRLEVCDDGRGGDHEEGSGLRGMRERVAAVGGDVERWTDAGTAVRVTVPA